MKTMCALRVTWALLFFLLVFGVLVAAQEAQAPLVGDTDNGQGVPSEEGLPPKPGARPVAEPLPEASIPEGCRKVDTPSGIPRVECEVEKEEFQDLDVKPAIEECDGKFEIVNGNPMCIKKGETGFAGTVCPSQDELDAMAASCNGKVERFVDDKVCYAIVCKNEGFKERVEARIEERYGSDPVKTAALKCQSQGGQLSIIKGQPKCISAVSEPVVVKENLGEVSVEKVQQAVEKLEKVGEKLDKAVEKLDPLKNASLQEGNLEQAKVFEESKKKVEEIKERVAEVKTEILSGNLSEELRRGILMDLQEIKNKAKKITFAIINGKLPTEEDIKKTVYKQYEFYGSPFASEEDFEAFVEKEKEVNEIIRNCDKYPEGKSFVPPDPEGLVKLVELQPVGENCVLKVHSAQGGIAEVTLDREAFSNWTGPDSAMNAPCSGNCGFFEEMQKKMAGTTPEEQCVSKCVKRGCNKSMLECMHDNQEKCDIECGLRKEGEGPFVNGKLDMMQACIMACIKPYGIQYCEPGGSNQVCNECEQLCSSKYGPGIGYEHCLSEEKLDALKIDCYGKGMYPKPYELPTPDGGSCIAGVKCVPFEESEGQGVEGEPPQTGQFALGNIFEAIKNFIGRVFK